MTSIQATSEPTPLTRIPKALGSLWERCRATEEDITLSRALTMNFVAVTHCDTETCLDAAVGDVLHRHPCRAFLIFVDETRRELEARVSGESRRHGRCQEIVLERIDFQGATRHFQNLASVVRPLLVNDIPTFLYWATALPSDPKSFLVLRKMADHCVVDTALLSDPEIELRRLEGLTADGPPVSDLTWLRLRPWRRALAEALEHVRWNPKARTEITLRHGPGTGGRAASILLARWVERRLGARAGLEEVEAPSRQTPEALELCQDEASVLVCHEDDARLRVEVTLRDKCVLPFHVPASRGTPGHLLAAAIDMA